MGESKMKLSRKQEKLFEFVKEKHLGQQRKYTNKPYHNHCLNVAETISTKKILVGVETALCHDLFEDTNCTHQELF